MSGGYGDIPTRYLFLYDMTKKLNVVRRARHIKWDLGSNGNVVLAEGPKIVIKRVDEMDIKAFHLLAKFWKNYRGEQDSQVLLETRGQRRKVRYEWVISPT